MPRSCLLATLVVAVFLTASDAQDKKPQTIPGWGTVVDPDGDCRVTKENGKLTMKVPGAYHDLTHSEGRDQLNSPRVLQETKGDFVVQVKVNPFPIPAENTSTSLGICFVSSGLLIWIDGDNFIRMDRAAVAGLSTPAVLVEFYKEGKQVTTQFAALDDKPTHLRITRTGAKLTFDWSDDGMKWTAVHSEEVTLPPTISVGVLAINTTTREFAPQLEELTVTAK
jgi:regulation of enolase protein 1 (concanavalin A-like superfamily)